MMLTYVRTLMLKRVREMALHAWSLGPLRRADPTIWSEGDAERVNGAAASIEKPWVGSPRRRGQKPQARMRRFWDAKAAFAAGFGRRQPANLHAVAPDGGYPYPEEGLRLRVKRGIDVGFDFGAVNGGFFSGIVT